MTTRGLRDDAFKSIEDLRRPLNEALKDIGVKVDGLISAGERVIVGPITIALDVSGTTLPVRIGVPLNGTIQALHLSRVLPNDPNETPASLGVPYWTLDPDGKIVLRALPGLANGKTYRLYFEAVMEA